MSTNTVLVLKKTTAINFGLLSLTCLVAFYLYWGGLENIFSRWADQPEYSHGYLIPLISLYILWEKRNLLLPYLRESSAWGIPLCIAALVLLFVGEISALYILIHYSFLLFLFSLSLIFCGKGTRITWVSIVFLAFSVPLPYVIEVILTAKLQLLSSSLGVSIIRLFEIPVYLSGNVIDLGEFKLHVVEACSGLRYLYPLVCIGVITAYLYRVHFWKRLFIVATTIPISIVMNSVRIAVTGVLVENFGSEVAEGFLHDFEGWVVFLLCLIVLMGEIVILEACTTQKTLKQIFQVVEIQYTTVNCGETSLVKSLGLKCCLLFLMLIAFVSMEYIDKRVERSVQSKSLASFPMRIGSWSGMRERLSSDVIAGLGFSDHVLANYTDGRAQVNLYVAHYNNQRKGVSPHSPKVCIPGGGWEITKFSRVRLQGIPVNRVLIQKGNQRQLVYYWFVERGTVVANEYEKKWLLFRDAVLENRTDGALVRIVTSLSSEESMADADIRMLQFVDPAHIKIMEYLPSA